MTNQLYLALLGLFNEISYYKFDFPPEFDAEVHPNFNKDYWTQAFKTLQDYHESMGHDRRFWLSPERLKLIKAMEKQ